MDLTAREELALLRAEVAELRAEAAPSLQTMGHIKEMLFYSSLAVNDQLLVDGEWETVTGVVDSDPDMMTIDFGSGLSVVWSKGRTVLRRAIPSRIPDRPNQVPRGRQ